MSGSQGHSHEAERGRARKVASQAYGTASSLEPEERDRLLMEQLPEVYYIARRIHDHLPRQVLLEDLVQAGTVGLIEAIHKYNPSKCVLLKTYAKFRIRGAILDSLRSLDWSPRTLRRKARALEDAHGRLRARVGRPGTESELAAELGMSLEDLQSLLGDLRGLDLGSLQAITPVDGCEGDLQTGLPAATDEDPYFLCLKSEMRAHLARAMRELPEKEALVLSRYHYQELKMKEVGAGLGVGEARVSQIHSSALVHLRVRMRELLASRPHQRAANPEMSSQLA